MFIEHGTEEISIGIKMKKSSESSQREDMNFACS